MALDVAQFKQNQRKMWSAGDYPDLARTVESAAEALVARCDIRPGHEVLDVATGSGNAAIVAARLGARVTGLDLTPELFDAARGRMAEEGVEIELIEGDAEELPFAAGSFDRVLSAFGAMFAPRHEQAADELTRVCRPGGIVGVAAWTPEGILGRMFRTTAVHLPTPPDLEPPTRWGTEDHMRGLFAGSGAELAFERLDVTFVHDSPDAWIAYYEQVLGPTMFAKSMLESEGKWEGVRAELVDLFEAGNQATDGTMRVAAEYLITIARLPE
jgi:SAM-dependent methyltransferase